MSNRRDKLLSFPTDRAPAPKGWEKPLSEREKRRKAERDAKRARRKGADR